MEAFFSNPNFMADMDPSFPSPSLIANAGDGRSVVPKVVTG